MQDKTAGNQIPEFYDACKKIPARLMDECNLVDTPDYYYHYTSIEGLKGIIENKKIWLTHWKCLNDDSEINHGLKVFKRVLNQYGNGKSKNIKDFICTAIGFLVENRHYFDELYICSFTKNSDSLDQWRAYCPDRGYCIGIPKKTLVHLDAFTKCLYQDEKQRKIAEDMLDCFFRECQERNLISGKLNREQEFILLKPLFLMIVSMSLNFKNSHFKNEEELRLVVPVNESDKNEIQFHMKDATFIPHIEREIVPEGAKLPGLRIIVGPPERPLAKEMLEKYLESQNCIDFEVILSKAPYIDKLS